MDIKNVFKELSCESLDLFKLNTSSFIPVIKASVICFFFSVVKGLPPGKSLTLLLILHHLHFGLFSDGSVSKESTCNAGDLGSIPGWGRFLEKEMATHSSILAWRIPWTEEPGGLQSIGSQRVRHD